MNSIPYSCKKKISNVEQIELHLYNHKYCSFELPELSLGDTGKELKCSIHDRISILK